MANTKFKDLAVLTSMTDSIIVPTSDGTTTRKITGANLKNYFSPPAAHGCFHKKANVTATASDTVYAFDWYTDTTAHLTDDVTVTSSDK